MKIDNKNCEVISFCIIKTEGEDEVIDPSKEFGFKIKTEFNTKTVIEMSKDEMVSLIRNTIDYLLPEYHLIKVEHDAKGNIIIVKQ